MTGERIIEYRVTGIDYEDDQVNEEVEYQGRDLAKAKEAYVFLGRQTLPFDRIVFERRSIRTSAWNLVPTKERL